MSAPEDQDSDEMDLDEMLAALEEENAAAERPAPQPRPQAAPPPSQPSPVISKNVAVVKSQASVIIKDDKADQDELMNVAAQVKKDSDMISGEILSTWRDDRAQIQKVIETLLPHLEAATHINGEGNPVAGPPRVYVEALVQLLDTKASTGLTAVKLLDARTRLLAAMKPHIVVNNNNNNSGPGLDADLVKILKESGPTDA